MSYQFQIAAIAYAALRAAVHQQEETPRPAGDPYLVTWLEISCRLAGAWTELDTEKFLRDHTADVSRAIAPAWRLELVAGGVFLTPRLAPVVPVQRGSGL